ncbi:MAG: NADH-quinone oxidoreductase subunit M [Ginsengibacter sp.]
MGTYITFPELLLWLPVIFGCILFTINDAKTVKRLALISSLLTLGISITSLFFADNSKYFLYNNVSYVWLQYIGSSFAVGLDGLGHMLTFLTAVSFPLIFAATYNTEYKRPNVFYGLMLLSQAGLMGVFVAIDALVFYFFWELALIPVYFLCSKWGGEKRIQATFKFFIYTFVSSLLMLVGIIYIYLQTSPTATAEHSFSVQSFYSVVIAAKDQTWLFIIFFLAFAVKMPMFPFHTWQPDTYEQAPAATTMVLSGIMVKMGVFGVIRWILPIFDESVLRFDNIIIGLSVAGMLYASCLAMVQNDLKRIVAYSSIAHVGLMCATMFALNNTGLTGVMIQMFNHGINVIALWIVVDIIEKHTGIRKLSELGGLAQHTPLLAIFFVIIALANIALPLTNAFIGEFAMFTGLFEFNPWFAAIAGISIILSAVYTLNMIQKVFFGNDNIYTKVVSQVTFKQKLSLSIIVAFIFVLGVYPKPMIKLTNTTVTNVLKLSGPMADK